MVTILSMMAMKSMHSSLPEAAGEAATVLVVGCISPPCIMGRTPPTSRSTPVLFRWPEATDISLSLTYREEQRWRLYSSSSTTTSQKQKQKCAPVLKQTSSNQNSVSTKTIQDRRETRNYNVQNWSDKSSLGEENHQSLSFRYFRIQGPTKRIF